MLSEQTNSKIIGRYGNVENVVKRLNELGTQKALAAEVDVAPSTVLWFLRQHGVVQRYVIEEQA